MSPHPVSSPLTDQVTITLHSHDLIDVDPPVVCPQDDSTTRIQLVEGPRGSRHLAHVRVPLVDPHGVSPCAGLVEAIALDLQSRGDSVHIQRPDLRNLPCPQTKPHVDSLDHFWAENPRGLISYQSISPSRLTGEIATRFPNATIAVAAASNHHARQIHHQLCSWGLPVTFLSSNREPQCRCERIVVGTFHALGHTAVESGKRDLFLVPQATDALHRSATDCLVQADFRCKTFGFLPAGQSISLDEQDRLATIFGFRQLTVPGEGMQAVTPVVAAWCFKGGRRLAPQLTPRELKQNLERDEMRRRELVKIAGLVWNNELREQASLPKCDQVILLTDSLIEAGELGGMLACPVATPQEVDPRSLPKPIQRALTNRPGWTTGPGLWVTTTNGAERISLPNASGLTVVVWAGAGKGVPVLPASWLRTVEGCNRHLLLVDFQDRQHWQLKQWNKSRSRNYQHLGWLPPGVDATTHRIRAFLKRCGRGETR